jgi:outer membrane protein TolC
MTGVSPALLGLAPLGAVLLSCLGFAIGGRVAQAAPLSLEQALELGLPTAPERQRSRQQQARDQALLDLNLALRRPRLGVVGAASFNQVGSSTGLITGLPTLGDISLGFSQNTYAVLQNSFGNVGLVLDVNLLPLRQGAQVAASRARLRSSRVSSGETDRQVRLDLVTAYRQLQLAQALVPVWQQALQASTALLRDVEALHRHGLVPRIDGLRARALQAGDVQGLAHSQAQLAIARSNLGVRLGLEATDPPEASDPIVTQPAWPLDLQTTLPRSRERRPLREALQAQMDAQRQEARAARATLLPSLSLVAGAGYSGNSLAVPVLNNSASLQGPVDLALPGTSSSLSGSGSFYNWGVALLMRQPLYDGGSSSAAATAAERERDLLQTDEQLARRRIRQTVVDAWSALQAAPAAIAAGEQAVTAGQRALDDAQRRYRAMVEPLTEVLLVQRDLQAARAALLTSQTRQAIDRAVLERETGELLP